MRAFLLHFVRWGHTPKPPASRLALLGLELNSWFVSGVLLFLLFFSLTSPAQADFACRGHSPVDYQPIAKRYTHGVLFKVGKCGKTPSFLLGTVHSDDPALEELMKSVTPIMQQAVAAGFEYVEPEDAAALSRKYLFAEPDQPGLEKVLDAPTLAALAEKLHTLTGIPETDVARLKPWAAAVILQYPAPTGNGVVLDMQLQQQAAKAHKQLFGLETLQEQYAVFDDIPRFLQQEMLHEAIADQADLDAMNTALIAAYLQEDLGTIQQISDRASAEIANETLRNLLEKRVITDRNALMVKRLLPELKAGRRFVAVGALHLTGKLGILQLLENQGYLVEAIPIQNSLPGEPNTVSQNNTAKNNP